MPVLCGLVVFSDRSTRFFAFRFLEIITLPPYLAWSHFSLQTLQVVKESTYNFLKTTCEGIQVPCTCGYGNINLSLNVLLCWKLLICQLILEVSSLINRSKYHDLSLMTFIYHLFIFFEVSSLINRSKYHDLSLMTFIYFVGRSRKVHQIVILQAIFA